MNTNNIEKQNSHLNLQDQAVQDIFLLYQDYPEVPYISEKRDKEGWLSAVRIGSEQLVPKRNMIRFEEDILPGHLILLWRIQFGTFTNESVCPKYFEYNYGINGRQALDEVIEKGYAVEQSATDSLDHLNAAGLKAILKHYAVTGYSKMKKPELMKLAKQELSEDQLASQFPLRGYRITPAGEAILAKYPEVVDRHPKKKY